MSHPAWVCGLKQGVGNMIGTKFRSHPAWVCGLKLAQMHPTQSTISHTLRGCVD